MLGTVSTSPTDVTHVSAKEIASGLLAEMRANLEIADSKEAKRSPAHEEKLDELFKRLETSLEAQIRTQRHSERPSEALERVMTLLNNLSPEAKTLAYILASEGSHLTFKQFQALSKTSLAEPVAELRDGGLLTPLSGLAFEDNKISRIPVYYFPSGVSQTFRAALLLMPEPSEPIRRSIRSQLRKVGYPPGIMANSLEGGSVEGKGG